MSQDSVRVLIAAGGTGGHIFPALHIARALKLQDPSVAIAFVGSGRDLEKKIIEGNGFKLYAVPAVRIMQSGFLGLVKFALTLPKTTVKVRQVFKDFRPTVVLGMGGYITVVPITLAKFSSIPTWIHEAEKSPGLANKLLGLYADKVSVAFAETKMLRPRPVVHSGHPVRSDLAGIANLVPAKDAPRHLLIVGGSQGARALDGLSKTISPLLAELKISVRHQTRDDGCDAVRSAYADAGVEATVAPFFDDMAETYNWADIIVSRAGAGTVSELTVINRPAILVPYPYAQGAHQKSNALTLVDAGKAFLIEEGPSFSDEVASTLRRLADREQYLQMRSGPVDFASLSAADTIASKLREISSR